MAASVEVGLVRTRSHRPSQTPAPRLDRPQREREKQGDGEPRRERGAGCRFGAAGPVPSGAGRPGRLDLAADQPEQGGEMSGVTVYGLPHCTTCVKALDYLR